MNKYGYAQDEPAAPLPPSQATLLSITGDFASIEGKFKINDSLHIECEIGGELEVGGRLVIGESGVVNADVRTVDALIMGSFEGNLVATGNVEIASTGRVVGNLKTDSLVIAKGGFFNGSVAKIDKAKQPDVQTKDWKKDVVGKKNDLVSSVVSDFKDKLDDEEEEVEFKTRHPAD
jgi:cytoskeletal protein CcmA (bactofilin family)